MDPNDYQTTYDKLVDEILANKNLDTKDRMRFYELHNYVFKKQNKMMYTLINHLIERQRKNYRYLIDKVEELRVFEELDRKRELKGLNRYEYNYLAFLINKHGLYAGITTPILPSVTKISIF